MDPHQRLLLEVSYSALVLSGHTREMLMGSSVGVFVGTMTEGDWNGVLAESSNSLRSPFAGNAGGAAALAGRVSFVLGLKGPAVSTSTVCSSSLVALDAACQGLMLSRCGNLACSNASIMARHPCQPISSHR